MSAIKISSKKTQSTVTLFTYDEIEAIANHIKLRVDVEPQVGVICGTGLGHVATLIKKPKILEYKDIPGFPHSTVQGHKGRLLLGHIGPTPVVCMDGRFHFFEGYSMAQCVLPIRVMKLLGVTTLILSNAAGSLNPSFLEGDIMLFKDHINFPGFAGNNPLQGENDERFGPRFVAMNDAYDKDLLKIAKDAAKAARVRELREGVYVCLGGPSFETVAELKILKTLGADAVGMSTVHEVIAARHCGIRCLAFSLITNKCVTDYKDDKKPNHQEILSVSKRKEDMVTTFIEKLFQFLAASDD